MGLSRESDDGGGGTGGGEVVEVKSAVPAGGNEDLVFRGVDNASHWLGVFAHDSLFAGLEIDSVLISPSASVRKLLKRREGVFSYFVTLLSSPAVKASLSLLPKHTSMIGARCSYCLISVADGESLSSIS